MSGILKAYFSGNKIKSLNKSSYKNLKSFNNNQRLFNTGLVISENNILKINKGFPNSTIKTYTNTNTNYTSDYYNTKTNKNVYTFNNFNPKKNNDSFYDNMILTNNFRKKPNKKKLNPIYNNIFPSLSINSIESKLNKNHNKVTISSFPLFSKKNANNKIIIKENNICKNIKKERKRNLLTDTDSKENSAKVEKIVNSLITQKNEKGKKLHHVNSSEDLLYKKNQYKLFPKEKSISPFSYIHYNLLSSPGDKKLFKSFNKQLQSLNNKPEYRERILNYVDSNYRNSLKADNLRNEINNKIYIDLKNKETKGLFSVNKKGDSKILHFNLYDYYNNIHKLKANKRNKFNRNYGKIKKLFKGNKRVITFDKKAENFEASTIKAIKHLNSLSFSNRKMMNNILNIYNKSDLNNK